MALFNRRKNQTISELESYYSNKRTNSARAWLMAFLSLLITIGIVAALFFGGRWIYQSITNDDTATETTGEINQPAEPATPDENVDAPTDEEEFPSVVSGEAARTNEPNTDRVNNSSREVAGSTTDSELPDTGAGDLVIILPLLAGVAGYVYSRKRLQA